MARLYGSCYLFLPMPGPLQRWDYFGLYLKPAIQRERQVCSSPVSGYGSGRACWIPPLCLYIWWRWRMTLMEVGCPSVSGWSLKYSKKRDLDYIKHTGVITGDICWENTKQQSLAKRNVCVGYSLPGTNCLHTLRSGTLKELGIPLWKKHEIKRGSAWRCCSHTLLKTMQVMASKEWPSAEFCFNNSKIHVTFHALHMLMK